MQRCPHCGQIRPLADFPLRSRGVTGSWCRECHREAKCGPLVDRACDGCGTVLRVTERRSREPRVFCSRACKDAARKAAAKAARVAAKASVIRVCPQCGNALAPTKRSDARFCSKGCEEAAHNATRKASWKAGERQGYVSRAEIIARCKSRCHLCKRKVNPADIHLDHIIPLSAGGTHTADNLAVAHAECNLRKGARFLTGAS